MRRRSRAHPPRNWPTDAAGLDGLRVIIANWRDPWHPEAGGAERYAWEMARALTTRGAAVRFLTARGHGQSRGECRDGIEIIRRGGRFTLYPRALGWLLGHRRWADAVLDCQNGIPFFTPLVLPRRVPVLATAAGVLGDQSRGIRDRSQMAPRSRNTAAEWRRTEKVEPAMSRH